MNDYTVYKHTSPSGKVYIGITRQCPEKRWDRGRGYEHNPHFRAAIEKYGWAAFKQDILASGLTKQEAEEAEIELIAQFNSTDRRFGYNIEKGGSAPGRASEETRQKLRTHMLGDNNPTRRLGHPFEGRHHTEAARLKMSEAAKTRKRQALSPETRQKLRDTQKKRPVECVESGVVYSGIHEAAEANGLEPSKICAVCRGRRKTTGGLHWAYKDKGQAAAIEALRLEIIKE